MTLASSLVPLQSAGLADYLHHRYYRPTSPLQCLLRRPPEVAPGDRQKNVRRVHTPGVKHFQIQNPVDATRPRELQETTEGGEQGHMRCTAWSTTRLVYT